MARKKNPIAPTPDMARKIWLAGIGAYGRAFSEAQESLAKMGGDTSKLFEDLVERGEEIEDTVESHGRDLAKRVKPAAVSIDDRIKQMRARLLAGERDHDDNGDRLSAIEERLAAIDAKLDQLLSAGSSRAAPRKTARKKTAAKKSS